MEMSSNYGNMFELTHGSLAQLPTCISHVIKSSPPTTSALPRLITHRPALILYGRPCDRNRCLVPNGIFTRFVPVSRFALFLFLGLVDLTLVLHIAVWCPN